MLLQKCLPGWEGDISAVGMSTWDWECLFLKAVPMEYYSNWMLCLAVGSRKPSGCFLLFLPPVRVFWSFRKLVQGTCRAGEENPAEEISLIWLLTKWRSSMKMAIVAEVSATEEMCVEPQYQWTTLFVFMYIILCVLNQEWGCFGWIWYLLWLVTVTVETLLKLQLNWQFYNCASILSWTRKNECFFNKILDACHQMD